MKKQLLLSFFGMTLYGASLAQIPSDSLMCFYPFNNNVEDSVSTHDGTNNGCTFGSDRFGNANAALYMDGLNDNVAFDDMPLVDPDFTISFWMNYDNIMSGEYRLISKREICGSGNFIDIAVSTGNTGMECYTGSSSVSNAAAGGSTSSGAWFHVAYVLDDQAQATLKYIDGVLVSTNSWGGPTGSIDNNASLGLAISPCINGGSVKRYQGYVDDIRVYYRSLTANEITALFQEPNPATVGINEKENKMNVKIFPNPATNNVTISCDGNISSVAVFDLSGKLILTQNQNNFSIEDLANGIYSIVVSTENGVHIDKLVKN